LARASAGLWAARLPHARRCVPSASQQCRRAARAGTPVRKRLFVVRVQPALHVRLVSERDLSVESAPILAWRQRDRGAALGHPPALSRSAAAVGYRGHTLLRRDPSLPLLGVVAPANGHDALFARPYSRPSSDASRCARARCVWMPATTACA
jgi:hypothetical protein